MKQFSCGDVVPGCSAIMRGNSDEEILLLVAAHAQRDHGMSSVPEALVAQVRTLIRPVSDRPAAQ